VVEKLLEADVGQRVLDELFEHAERHRRYMGARLGGVDHVKRISNRGGQYLGLETLDAIDLADVTDEVHADGPDVVEAPEAGAEVEGAGLGAEQRLGRREAERMGRADALAGEVLRRLKAGRPQA